MHRQSAFHWIARVDTANAFDAARLPVSVATRSQRGCARGAWRVPGPSRPA